MSQPNSATLRQSSSSQPPVKSLSNSVKNPPEKPVIGINKFELKSLADTIGPSSEKSSARQNAPQSYSSQTPQNQQAYSHQHYSPTNSARKAPINPVAKTKSINDKKSSLKLSLETLDFKDAIGGGKKAYPTTSKATKTSYATNPVEKLKNGTKKSSSISKDEKVKSFLSTYESLFDRKSPTNKDVNNKIKSSLDQKELRNNFIEEPPKKSSLPNNLTQALNNIYGNNGSSSHRTSMNYGPSETAQTSASNKMPTYSSKNKRNDEEDEQTALIITNSSNVVPQVQLQSHPGPAKYSFNNLVIDLAKINTDSNKNISQISINNINNINTVNNSHVIAEERVAHLRSSSDFTNILKEKNDEIQKLNKDKNELRATVEILINQMNDMKRSKFNIPGERDETTGNLTQSAVEMLGSTNESKETYKESKSQSARQLQKQLQSSKSFGQHYMSKDMESVKMIVDQLKNMTDSSEKVINKALEQKNTLIETLTKENLRKSKKNIYNSAESQAKDSKKPQHPVSNFNTNQRSASISEKAQESPYYDALKGAKKPLKDSGSTIATKKPTSAGPGWSSSNPNTRGKEGSNKAGLYIDTAEGFDTLSSLTRTQPNTTTNAELEQLRRKFSHDPKLVSEVIAEMFEKRSYRDDKGGQFGKVDIGTALNDLKGRISGLLERYKSDKNAKKKQK